ncbi:MAG: molecular chaperone DnaJ [Solirubrobacteraceae bacterium]
MSGWSDLRELGLAVRPLEAWPEAFDAFRSRRPSPFRASIVSTAALLADELRHLEARDAVLELAVEPGQFRRDGMPYAAAVAHHPGVVLSLPRTLHGPLRYFTDEFDRWQDNLRAVALSLKALRAVDRYGVSRRGEQYRGWRALEAGDGAGPDLLQRGRELIAEHGTVRAAMRATHPDRGGDAADFRAVLHARNIDFGSAS